MKYQVLKLMGMTLAISGFGNILAFAAQESKPLEQTLKTRELREYYDKYRVDNHRDGKITIRRPMEKSDEFGLIPMVGGQASAETVCEMHSMVYVSHKDEKAAYLVTMQIKKQTFGDEDDKDSETRLIRNELRKAKTQLKSVTCRLAVPADKDPKLAVPFEIPPSEDGSRPGF